MGKLLQISLILTPLMILLYLITLMREDYVDHKKLVHKNRILSMYSDTLVSELGYGGLIDNFKNYLLTRSNFFQYKAKRNISNLKDLGLLVENIDDTGFKNAHNKLLGTVVMYENDLNVMSKYPNLTVEELGKIVAPNNHVPFEGLDFIGDHREKLFKQLGGVNKRLALSIYCCGIATLSTLFFYVLFIIVRNRSRYLKRELAAMSVDSQHISEMIDKFSIGVIKVDMEYTFCVSLTGKDSEVKVGKLLLAAHLSPIKNVNVLVSRGNFEVHYIGIDPEIIKSIAKRFVRRYGLELSVKFTPSTPINKDKDYSEYFVSEALP